MLNLRRRQWIGYASATAAGLGLTRPALAQFAGDKPPQCPPGYEWHNLSFNQSDSKFELSIGNRPIGITISLPWEKTRWKGECRKAPPPPKPPKPPRQFGSGIWDLENFTLKQGWLDPQDSVLITSANMYWEVGMPAFTSLASSTARLLVSADLSSGQTITSSHTLVRDMNGFRLANPAALDHWNATAAATAVSGSYDIGGISLMSHAAGSAPYGVAMYVGETIVASRSRSVAVQSSGTGGSQID